MTRPSVHVCVATGQNLPNLIPALQLGAQEVVILETPEMRDAARNLKRALEAHGIKVRRVPFDDTSPETISRAAEKVAIQLGERPLVLNATGGHKLMTLALAEKMPLADELHLLYAETRHDRLDWLKPEAAIEPMEDVLTLEDVLIVQGYRIQRRGSRDVQWMQNAAEREPLTRQLGDRADTLAGLFGTLNWLADEALANEPGGPFRPEQQLPYPPDQAGAKVLKIAVDLELLHWDRHAGVVFSNPEAARYFRGGWLEEYAGSKLRGLKPKDWDVNVEIESVQGKTPNEFDALAVHRNRLLVIECKTSRFGRDAGRDADHIYKLAQLSRNVGGIMRRSLLLSARSLPPDTCQRARENGVDVLAAREVKDLVGYLKTWMGR